MDERSLLVTGGSGLLGGELRPLLPEAHFPASAEFDVADYAGMEAWLARRPCRTVFHAAALTSPPRVDREPERALMVNVVGTANVVRLCLTHGMRLVYISTDYVFDGSRGRYREDDPVHPVNKYAWSKLGGECAVRMMDDALIVRTSFGPNVFPYEKAFVDQWTSRQCVRDFARQLVGLLHRDLRGVLHVGGPRRTVYEYARSLDPSRPVRELSIREVSFRVPVDTSLDCRKYGELTG
jgi:dTDP-4-dehydrorhamnose reductase